jgi:hypothetical protein
MLKGIFLNEAIGSGPVAQKTGTDRIEEEIGKVINKTKSLFADTDTHTEVLAKAKKLEVYNDYIEKMYNHLANIHSESQRESFINNIQFELTVARKAKEHPEEYFRTAEAKANGLRGIDKYITDLEKLESKAKKVVIRKED